MGSADEQTTESRLTYNTVKSLETARAYTALLGQIPSSFTSTIRTLLSEHEKNSGKASTAGRYMVTRFLNSPSMLSPVYFAGLTFYPDAIAKSTVPFKRAAANEFGAADLAAIIGLIYLFRRAKGLSNEENWGKFSNPLMRDSELGGHLGMAIPKMQFAQSMLAGALPWIGPVLFMKHDEKGTKTYLRHLKDKGVDVDPEFEMKTWGCTRYDVASVLVQLLGFGVAASEAYGRGMAHDCLNYETLDREAYRYRIIHIWINNLIKSGKAPDIAHRGEFYPTQVALTRLAAVGEPLSKNGSLHRWLEKNKDDINPQATPALFASNGAKTESVEAPVPEDIKAQIDTDQLEKDLG